MSFLLHVTSAAAWAAAQAAGVYAAPSLAQQGYIHLSAPEQVLRVANFLYAGQRGLVLLVIDAARVQAEVRWEEYAPGSPLFPHLYSPLQLGAVVRVLDFPPQPDGTFVLPADFPREGEGAG